MSKGLTAFILFFSISALSAQENPLIHEELKQGVIWQYFSFSKDDIQQSINVLTVDPGSVELDVISQGNALIRTSVFAGQNSSLAAINGSFFNVKEGGSVVFYQNEKRVEAHGSDEDKFTEQGAFSIRAKSTAEILTKSRKGWKKKGKYRDILASGPLLIVGGRNVALGTEAFYTNRHPRTAVGLLDDGGLVFVVVDGRNQLATGMTLQELAQWMVGLGCISALNLDGGGSSTMWIRGRSENGVVNYPSDNGGFDHLGERPVANAIIIH